MIFPRKEFTDESLKSTLVGTPQKEKGRVGGNKDRSPLRGEEVIRSMNSLLLRLLKSAI